MQPEGRRGIRRSKAPPNTSGPGPGSLNAQAASPSPPRWTEWKWDDNRQMLHRTLINYNGRILREQFGTGLERIRDDGQTTAGVPPPNYGSAVGLGQLQPSTESGRPKYIERPSGIYQSTSFQEGIFQPSSRQSYQETQPMTLDYDPATTDYYSHSTQMPQAKFYYKNSSYSSPLGTQQPQQPQNLDSMYDSMYEDSDSVPLTSFQNLGHGSRIPSAQSHRHNNLSGRSPLGFGRSAQYEELSGAQDEAGYETIRKPEAYFRPGRIFKARTNLVESEKGSQAEQTFVVLQEGPGAAVCAPLQTYDAANAGYAFGGENSALVFATGDKPQLLPWEDPSGMAHFPVFIEEPSERIDPKSRINLANNLMIEHSAKVRNVGRVDRNSVKELRSTFPKVTGVQPDPYAQQTEWRNNNNADENDSKSSGTFLDDRSKDNDIEYSVDEPSVQSDYADQDDEQLELSYADSSYSNVTHHRTAQRRQSIAPRSSRTTETRQITSKASGSGAPLYPEYKLNKSKRFRRGSVLKLVWSEPLGNTKLGDSESAISELLPGQFGETVYQCVRRFVIVKEREGHSLGVPILTYGFQGTKKLGVKSQDHAIIYTGQEAPEPLPGEDLQWNPIKLEPATDRDKLAPQSRINYAKVYTIEHNVKVQFIGKIHADSKRQFFEDFKVIDSREEIPI